MCLLPQRRVLKMGSSVIEGNKFFISLLILVSIISATCASNILVFIPLGTKSHMNVVEPLVRGLADQNHQLTVVSAVNFSIAQPHVKEMVPVHLNQVFNQFPNIFEMKKSGIFALLATNTWDFLYDVCEKIFEMPEIVSLQNEKFDLVIGIAWFPCFDGLFHKIGAPFVHVVTMATPHNIGKAIGSRPPASFVPDPWSGYSHAMTFWERLGNFALRVYHTLVIEPSYTRKSEAVYRKYFGEDTPGMAEIRRNVSMILSNSNYALNYPRPLLPQEVEVGGMHCRPAKALPKDLDDFLSSAKEGFIFFSMGSMVNTEQMPEAIRLKFINVFSRLKQKVLWKWNSGTMENLPSNVRLGSWLPQQDILGHPNIRVFMTHGGLLSTQEAAYHGVPLLGMPVFADQEYNMRQAVLGKYALKIDILDFTEEELETKLRTLINDQSYTKKAKKLSAVIKDDTMSPLDRALFWMNYIIRHKGTVHMASAARDLNLIQYHCLDVIAFMLFVTVAVLYIAFKLVKLAVTVFLHRRKNLKTVLLKEKKRK